MHLGSTVLAVQRATAVDDDLRAYRPGRLVRSQMEDSLGDFLGLSEAAERNSADDILVTCSR
jgi:hypothetical protein